jgi:hypothetical protein
MSIEDRLEILAKLMSQAFVEENRVFSKFDPIWFDEKTDKILLNKIFLTSIRKELDDMDILLEAKGEFLDLDLDILNDKPILFVPLIAILYRDFMLYMKDLKSERIIGIIDIPKDDGLSPLPVRKEGDYTFELFEDIIQKYECLYVESVATNKATAVKKDTNLVDNLREYFKRGRQYNSNKIIKFPDSTKWENVTIEFSRDGDSFYVSNSINGEVKEFHYKDIKKFVNYKTAGEPPSVVYRFFKDLYKFNGFIENGELKDRELYRKKVSDLNNVLNTRIPLSDGGAPLKNKKNEGHTIRFTIKDPDPFKYSLMGTELAEEIMKNNNVPFED